ncbi:hypothetical protein CCP3SC5AM1_2170001 [Gammaproteobacteria bacterium]
MFTPPVLNAAWFGVKGDGVTDDTVAFRSGLAVTAQNQGIFQLEGRTYITSGIILPSGLSKIQGVNHTNEKFTVSAQTVWKLKSGANSTLLRYQTGISCDLENICFDGNKSGQSIRTPLVYIDVEDPNGNRNEFGINNCIFRDSKGDGIFINRPEVYVYKTNSLQNEGHGFHCAVGCNDCIFDFALAGFNSGDGFRLISGGGNAGRFLHFDSFFNQGNGLYIDGGGGPTGGGAGGMRFSFGTINNNFKNSIETTGIIAKLFFQNCLIFGANWDNDRLGTNNPALNGTYSEVKIGDSIYSYGYNFTNCEIGVQEGITGLKKPKYCIEDLRTTNSVGFYSGAGVSFLNTAWGSASRFVSGMFSPGFTRESVRLGGMDEQFNNIGGGRFADQDIRLGGTIFMDGFGESLMYNWESGGWGVSLNRDQPGREQYFLISRSGNTSFPIHGQISALGNANLFIGNDVNLGGSINLSGVGKTLIYQSDSGWFNVSTNRQNPGSEKYFYIDSTGNTTFPSNGQLNIFGPTKITANYPQLIFNDTNQSASGGGMFRMLGEGVSYGGGYNLQFNTGVSADFTQGLQFLRFLYSGKSLSPGSDNNISLGSSTLLWASIQGNNFICYSGNVSALNGTLVQSLSGDNYLYNQTTKSDGNVGYSFARTGIVEWYLRDRGDRDLEILDSRFVQRMFIPQSGAADHIRVPAIHLSGITREARNTLFQPPNGLLIYQTNSGAGPRMLVTGVWMKMTMTVDS